MSDFGCINIQSIAIIFDRYSAIKDKTGHVIYVFLTDITLHMKKLNLKIQGGKKLICELLGQVGSFLLK